MAAKKLFKQTSKIAKGEKEGRPIYTEGARIRFLGLPTDKAGMVTLKGVDLSFEGSFDGTVFFTINDFSGKPLIISTNASQKVISNIGLSTSPAILPIRAPELFEGIQMIRPVVRLAEVDDQSIDFYQEIAKL